MQCEIDTMIVSKLCSFVSTNHLEDIQEPLTPREFTRCAIAVVSRWCDNVLTGRYSSVESVGSKLDCLERIYKNR